MNLQSLSTLVILSGIVVVLFILILLSVTTRLYGKNVIRFRKKEDKKDGFKIIERHKATDNNLINNEILAVIGCAAYSFCYFGGAKKVKIRRIENKKFGEVPRFSLWKLAGNIENGIEM